MRRSDDAVVTLRGSQRPADTRAALELAEAMGLEIARRRGKMRAQVAVARRLAVIKHRMWIEGVPFLWTRTAADDAACA